MKKYANDKICLMPTIIKHNPKIPQEFFTIEIPMILPLRCLSPLLSNRSQKNCWTLYSKLVKSRGGKGAEGEIFLNWKTVSQLYFKFLKIFFLLYRMCVMVFT